MPVKPEVIVYTTLACPWCVKAKEFLKKNNITFTEMNVMEDEQARDRMIEKSGQLGVPVIEIDETWIVGFHQSTIKKALNLS